MKPPPPVTRTGEVRLESSIEDMLKRVACEVEEVVDLLAVVGRKGPSGLLVDPRRGAVGAEQLDHVRRALGALDHHRRAAARDRLRHSFENAELGPLDVDLDEGGIDIELVYPPQLDGELLEVEPGRVGALGFELGQGL